MKEDSSSLLSQISVLALGSSTISASIVSSSVLISQVSTVFAELTLTDLLDGVLDLCVGRRPEEVILTRDLGGEDAVPPAGTASVGAVLDMGAVEVVGGGDVLGMLVGGVVVIVMGLCSS